MPMFQIMSDLHLETHPTYDDFQLNQTAPYLALLGDIGHIADDRLFSFLRKQLERYWAVFFLIGNHERYHLYKTAKTKMRSFVEKMDRLHAKSTCGKFVFLDQTRYDLNDKLTILGCTLFSKVVPEQEAAVESRFVDFKDILRWTVEDHNAAHESDLQWLNTTVAQISQEEPERKIVIFTHHSPCAGMRGASDPKQRSSEVSSGFATDLREEECWGNEAVEMWAFGHTHWNFEFVEEMKEGVEKRVLGNMKGYKLIPAKGFKMDATYRVGGVTLTRIY